MNYNFNFVAYQMDLSARRKSQTIYKASKGRLEQFGLKRDKDTKVDFNAWCEEQKLFSIGLPVNENYKSFYGDIKQAWRTPYKLLLTADQARERFTTAFHQQQIRNARRIAKKLLIVETILKGNLIDISDLRSFLFWMTNTSYYNFRARLKERGFVFKAVKTSSKVIFSEEVAKLQADLIKLQAEVVKRVDEVDKATLSNQQLLNQIAALEKKLDDKTTNTSVLPQQRLETPLFQKPELKDTDGQTLYTKVEEHDGNKVLFYYKDSDKTIIHRLGGPAIINKATGEKYWMKDDKPHRIDGPAIEKSDHKLNKYFIDGLQITKEKFTSKFQK